MTAWVMMNVVITTHENFFWFSSSMQLFEQSESEMKFLITRIIKWFWQWWWADHHQEIWDAWECEMVVPLQININPGDNDKTMTAVRAMDNRGKVREVWAIHWTANKTRPEWITSEGSWWLRIA
jgi:hypothetical protein